MSLFVFSFLILFFCRQGFVVRVAPLAALAPAAIRRAAASRPAATMMAAVPPEACGAASTASTGMARLPALAASGAFSGGASADADGFAFGAAAPPPPRAAAAASPLAPKERATTPSSGGSETAGLMGIAPMD